MNLANYPGLRAALTMLECDNGCPPGWFDERAQIASFLYEESVLNNINYLALRAKEELFGHVPMTGVEDSVLFFLVCGEQSEVEEFLCHMPAYLILHDWLNHVFGE